MRRLVVMVIGLVAVLAIGCGGDRRAATQERRS